MKCDHCKRAVSETQVALTHNFTRNRVVGREIVFHRSCVEKILKDAPSDVDVVAERVQEIRRELEEGTSWLLVDTS